MYKFVNSAATPPAAPDNEVLTAAWAAFIPTFSTSNNNADPGLNPNPMKAIKFVQIEQGRNGRLGTQ